jgi:hypothetical protein
MTRLSRLLAFIAFILLCFPHPAEAACTGSGTTWSCPAGSTGTDIMAAYTSASGDATITLANGNYYASGTNAKSNFWVKPTNSKGLTLQCATTSQNSCVVTNTSTTLATSGANATTVTSSTPVFPSDMEDLRIYSAGTNFVTGDYTVSSWVSTTQIVVSSTPTPSGAGSGGSGFPFTRGIWGLVDISGTNTRLYRITGITFNASHDANGAIETDAASQDGTATSIRIDHNWFTNIPVVPASTPVILNWESYNGGECAHPYGVADHNVFSGSVFQVFLWAGQNDPLFGTPPYPCAVTAHLGTANNFFLEDNTVTETNASPSIACSDAWGNSTFVVRNNTSTNCFWASHGAEHSGGPTSREHYNNTDTRNSSMDPAFQDGTAAFYHQGSGESMVFNNTVTPVMGAGHGVAYYSTDYRDGYSSADNDALDRIGDVSGGTGNDDINGKFVCSPKTSLSSIGGLMWAMTGTFGSNTSAHYKFAIYNSSNALLASSNSYAGVGGGIEQHALNSGATTTVSTLYYLCVFSDGMGSLPLAYTTAASGSSIVDSTQSWPTVNATLTHSSTGTLSYAIAAYGTCDGTSPMDSASFGGFAWPGNQSPIGTYAGYPCFHQPGRNMSGNLSPIYAFNDIWTDTLTRSDFVLFPIAGNASPIDGITPIYGAKHLIQEREFYINAGNLQSSSSSPFNGTTGIGIGTLANRPSTCTPTTSGLAMDAGYGGVGYWAVDQGSWNSGSLSYQIAGAGTTYTQGLLYTCTATNTWTNTYTPYNYPHPLVTGTKSMTFTSGPSNTVSGSAFSPVIVVTFSQSAITDSVTLTISGCGASLGGSTTVSASASVVTFTGVTATTIATGCTVTATDNTDGSVAAITSTTFNVTSAGCTPAKLAFTSQPSNAVINASLGTVVVQVQDSGGNNCSSDTSTITIANKAATCTGMTLAGTTSTSNVFTESNLAESAAGACTLHATDGSLTAADSNGFTISTPSNASTAALRLRH